MSIGSRWPASHRWSATAGVALALAGVLGMAGTAVAASATGPDGQTITVSKADGLDPAGETITVHGAGYDLSTGVYVVVCVNTGSGQQPTPCLGGADMAGGTGSSAWISSNPPSYGEGLAQPFDEAEGLGSFDVQLTVTAADEFTDCLDPAQAPDGCVVGTRADHTRSADRSADVLIPITFATGDSGEGGGDPVLSTPQPTSTGATDTSGGADLAETGSAVGPAVLAGLALLGGGAVVVVARRRFHKETS